MGRSLRRGPDPGLGRPGPNPLFFGVIAAIALGVVVAASTGDAKLLHSNLVFRVVVGGIVSAVAYGAVAAIWFAYHRRTFQSLNVAGSGAQAPDQGTAEDLRARDEELKEFMETATDALAELVDRVEDESDEQE